LDIESKISVGSFVNHLKSISTSRLQKYMEIIFKHIFVKNERFDQKTIAFS
jgi:hypothetical protein